jgi:hypothetical protein
MNKRQIKIPEYFILGFRNSNVSVTDCHALLMQCVAITTTNRGERFCALVQMEQIHLPELPRERV